jgi:NhaA family Na+:H+ antiporter
VIISIIPVKVSDRFISTNFAGMERVINLKPFREFLRSGTAGGVILMICVAVSLLIANSAWGPAFNDLLASEIGPEAAQVHLRYSVLTWINDGLMAVFFLMVGLEIKRELLEGELSSFRKAALPVVAALGGVLAPAGIYAFFNAGTETVHGWGIPMATDIAFALTVLTLMGRRVPVSLKIILAALAIVDDLMAILVIAVFYTSGLQLSYLLYAGGVFLLLLVFNRTGVKHPVWYLVPGVFIWYFIHHSGVHATIAGVLTAATLPTTTDDQESPLERVEHALMKPVNFIILPLFALANTNIRFEPGMAEGLYTALGTGIIAGLAIGKPVGILLSSWISVKMGLCSLPEDIRWGHIVGMGMLGGIGFTMSVFIALLSFSDPALLPVAKFAVLTGSLLSGIAGSLTLGLLHRRNGGVKS